MQDKDRLNEANDKDESNQPFLVEKVTTYKLTKPDIIRWLYVGAAVLLLIVMFLGFQEFYLHGRASGGHPLTKPILTLVISHGVTMTLWVILLVVQSFLVTYRNVRMHMILGKIGAVLAVLIFVLGFNVAIGSIQNAPSDAMVWNLPVKQFMALPITNIILFALFVSVGIWYRKKPEIHRSMMLTATLVSILAAADRYDPLVTLYRNNIFGDIFGPYFFVVMFGLLLLIIRYALTRSFDRYFALCCIFLSLFGVCVIRFATTSVWDRIATFLLQY